MKKIGFIVAMTALVVACNKKENTAPEQETVAEDTLIYKSFGAEFAKDQVLSKEEMLAKYQSMNLGDTLQVKFTSEIKNVCQKKGCWMTLDLSQDAQSFVKFKDYTFFVPMNVANHQAIVSGKAFVEETSVDALKHEAKDAGKTQEEIEQITEPVKNYRFEATGVLIAENN